MLAALWAWTSPAGASDAAWLFAYSRSLAEPDGTDAVSVIPGLFGFTDDMAVRATLNRDARAMLRQLDGALPIGTGVLARVRAFSNGVGSPTLPAQPIVPLAVGSDALDAMSEHLNLSTVQSRPVPPGYRDAGYYLWVQRVRARTFVLGVVPLARGADFETTAAKLADEKVRLTAAGRTYRQYQAPGYADRARFWLTRLQEAQDRFDNAGRRAAIEALVRRFDDLQREQAEIIQQAAERKQRRDALSGFIASANQVLSVGRTVLNGWKEAQAYFDAQSASRQTTVIKTNEDRLRSRSQALDSQIRDVERQLAGVPELGQSRR